MMAWKNVAFKVLCSNIRGSEQRSKFYLFGLNYELHLLNDYHTKSGLWFYASLSLSTLVNIFLKEKLSSDWAFLFFSDLLAFTGLANLLSFNPPPRATFILFGLCKLSNLHSLARQTFAVVVDFLSYTFFFW